MLPRAAAARAAWRAWSRGAVSDALTRAPPDAVQATTTLASSSISSAHSLVCVRGVEWGNVVLGFEQANRYTLADGDTGAPAALLAEDTGSVGAAVGRQLLRARRSFAATLLAPDGSHLATIKRPLYAINSRTVVEGPGGEEIAAVVARWAATRRRYDLFSHGSQFAEIDEPMLAWQFVVKNEDGSASALIDRNFTGFGRELFTDAGRYAIHFGDPTPFHALAAATRVIAAAHPEAAKQGRANAVAPADVTPTTALVPTSTGEVLPLAYPLSTLSHRLAVVAAAIAIDFDYFSRHSSAVGGALPFMVPVPLPGGGGGGDAADASGGGGGGSAADAGGGAPPPPPPPPDDPLARDLGSDEGGWFGGEEEERGGEFEGGGFDDNESNNAGWSWDGGDDDGGGGGDEGGGIGGLFDLVRGIFGSDD